MARTSPGVHMCACASVRAAVYIFVSKLCDKSAVCIHID